MINIAKKIKNNKIFHFYYIFRSEIWRFINSVMQINSYLFTRASHSWKIWIICFTRWNITLIHQEKGNILYLLFFCYI